MRYRIPLLAATVATVLSMTAGSAFAIIINGTLDSQQTNTTGSPVLPAEVLPAKLAQTFVPSLTGSLTTVQLWTLYPIVINTAVTPSVADVSVQIFNTDGSGNPTGPALATQTVTTFDGGWTTVVFGTPTNVTATTKYAIVMSGTAPPEWLGTCGNMYGPGTALIFSGSWQLIPAFDGNECTADFAFQTYIAVPAAATLAPTPAPTHTAPPTSTAGDTGSGTPGNPGYLLIFAGLAAAASAAVFVSISRRHLTQR
jgi:hypothetical protein